VVLLDAKAGRPMHVESIPLSTGKNLRDVEGRIDDIEAKVADFGDDYLRVTVITDGPVPGLAERVRRCLPNAIYVLTKSSAVQEAAAPGPRAQVKPQELFQEFCRRYHGGDPPPDLLRAFSELYEEASHATE
jgi:hypothetical protein